MSRPSGTWCFREWDVLIRDSDAFYTWQCYKDTRDAIRAYTVEITGMEGAAIKGNLYTQDYRAMAVSYTHLFSSKLNFRSGILARSPYINRKSHGVPTCLLYTSIDPPYNSRQYCDAYHLLENVARWEKPDVYGVAKKMDLSLIHI